MLDGFGADAAGLRALADEALRADVAAVLAEDLALAVDAVARAGFLAATARVDVLFDEAGRFAAGLVARLDFAAVFVEVALTDDEADPPLRFLARADVALTVLAAAVFFDGAAPRLFTARLPPRVCAVFFAAVLRLDAAAAVFAGFAGFADFFAAGFTAFFPALSVFLAGAFFERTEGFGADAVFLAFDERVVAVDFFFVTDVLDRVLERARLDVLDADFFDADFDAGLAFDLRVALVAIRKPSYVCVSISTSAN